MPTTQIDLTSPEVVADPYPFFAAERRRHAVGWDEGSSRWLTFDHASASAVLRGRRLGRIWIDREPAERFEPFNLLHRNQMMESEPPQHTRLRRLDAVDVAGFDVVGEYAEPLPVLVISDLLGVPTELAPQLRVWSQAIVKMYEVSPGEDVQDAAVRAARDFAELVRELTRARDAKPGDDLISDLVGDPVWAGEGDSGLSEDEVVASAVLLLNAGHEASGPRKPSCRRVSRRCCGSTRPSSCSNAPPRRTRGSVRSSWSGGSRSERADQFDVARDPNPHLAFGAGVHFCLGAPLARMELVESLSYLCCRVLTLRLVAEPVSRGTFGSAVTAPSGSAAEYDERTMR